jgi:hypothetical protein
MSAIDVVNDDGRTRDAGLAGLVNDLAVTVIGAVGSIKHHSAITDGIPSGGLIWRMSARWLC